MRPLKSGSSCQKVGLIHYFVWLSIWKTALGYLSFGTTSDGIDDILSTHSLHMRNSCWHSCFHLSEIFQLYTISDLAKHGFWKLYSLCLGSSLQRFLIGVKSPSLPCSLCQSCCSMNRCACPWTLLGHKGWAVFIPWELPWACKASPVSASALPLGAHGSALLTRCLVQLRIH